MISAITSRPAVQPPAFPMQPVADILYNYPPATADTDRAANAAASRWFSQWSANGQMSKGDLLTLAQEPELPADAVAILTSTYAKYESLSAANKGQYVTASDVASYHLGGVYSQKLDACSRTSTTLFNGPIDHSQLRQAYMPNCYAFTVMRDAARIHPDSIGQWIKPDGASYTVSFPNGAAETVATPTPAQQIILGGSGGNGLWGTILLSAWAQTRYGSSGPLGEHGGDEIDVMKLVTLRDSHTSRLADLPAGNLESILATAAGHLVCASTPEGTFANGLSRFHSYCVEAYEPDTKTVTFANVAPDAFVASANYAGVDLGNGRFTLSLDTVQKNFDNVTWES